MGISGGRKTRGKYNINVHFDHDLGDQPPAGWAGQVEQMLVRGSKIHQEFVFFHGASKTLILTDLIENFEASALPFWLRPILRSSGVMDPNGQMPFDMWMTFRGRRAELRACVQRMLDWNPSYVVLAHGRCFGRNCTAKLRHGFRRVLG